MIFGKVDHYCILITYLIYSVPPSIYKRVKQVPENKREAQLIKELEEILSKEGLSANPLEKGQDLAQCTTVDGYYSFMELTWFWERSLILRKAG